MPTTSQPCEETPVRDPGPVARVLALAAIIAAMLSGVYVLAWLLNLWIGHALP